MKFHRFQGKVGGGAAPLFRMKESGFFLGWEVTTVIPVVALSNGRQHCRSASLMDFLYVNLVCRCAWDFMLFNAFHRSLHFESRQEYSAEAIFYFAVQVLTQGLSGIIVGIVTQLVVGQDFFNGCAVAGPGVCDSTWGLKDAQGVEKCPDRPKVKTDRYDMI